VYISMLPIIHTVKKSNDGIDTKSSKAERSICRCQFGGSKEHKLISEQKIKIRRGVKSLPGYKFMSRS
jgi:hypothetical protein